MSSYLPTPKSKQPKPERPPKPVKAPEQSRPQEPAVAPEMEKPVRRQGLPDWLKGVVATLVVASLLFAGFTSFSFARRFVGSNFRDIGFFQPSIPGDETLAPGVMPTLVPLSVPAYKPWNGVERVTILVMGKDYRENGPETETGPSRTDTMILLSMDPMTKTAGMISIPRDLYVEIPGYGFNKINSAYFKAEALRLPGGGRLLAKQTVEGLLGIPIDYTAVIDFMSFTTVVDEIGGIDVYVPFDNMKIDPVGPEDVKLLFFGDNHLTGSEALAFARARYTEGGDIDRAARTQQVIIAIRDKVLNLGMLPTLIAKAPAIYSEISSSNGTDLTLDQILSLAMVAKDIPRRNIRQGVIDNDCIISYLTINIEGEPPADILVPNPENVRELRDRVFTAIGPLGYATPPADLNALALQEDARIRLLNGSGRDGLAGATKEWLVKLGFSEANIETGNESQIPTTQITDFSGMPYTVRWLSELMERTSPNLFTQVSMDSGVDVQIILGGDWSIPQE